MAATVLLLGLVLVAAVTDVLRRRIYNGTTYPGMLAALGLNAAGDLSAAVTDVDPQVLQAWLGWIGLGESLLGLVTCGLLMLVCYVFFSIGGGDVKLMAMIGALMGLRDGFEVTLWTFVIGGCMGVIVLIWRVGPLTLVGRLLRQIVYMFRVRGWSPPSDDERKQLQPPLFLAPCALAAVVIVRFSLLELLS